MKNLNLIFDLLLFPFLFLMRKFSIYFNQIVHSQRKNYKILFIIFSSFFIISSVSATPTTLPVISINSPTQDIIEDNNATLTISANPAPNNSYIDVEFTNTCDSNTNATILEDTTSIDLEIATDTLSAGTVCIITLTTSKSGSNSQNDGTISATLKTLTITIIADVSNIPKVSINPTAKNISVGTSDPEVYVKLNEAGDTDDTNVTYEHNCTGSLITKYITVPKGNTSKKLDVNTSALSAGETCTVTLTGADGIGTQDVNSTINPATSIITVLGSAPDLNISKTASVSSIEVNQTMIYTITVGNHGNESANNIVMTDILPFGVAVNTITPNGWTCTSIDTKPVVCTLTTLAINATASIDINVTVPIDNGIITNEANVSCNNEINLNDNDTSISVYVYDINNPSDLCYVNATGTGGNNKCGKAGSFYYSTGGCVASVQVVNISTSKGDVDNIIISKLYDPSAVGSTCGTSKGTCSGLADSTLTTEYPDYSKAYTYTVGTLGYENNVTITDTNTEADGTGNASVDDIILYSSYTIDGRATSGRIGTCYNSAGELSQYAANVDVVDDYSYTAPTYDPWIRTKVSKQTGYTMKAVYLGGYTDPTPHPQTYYPGGGDKAAELTILYKLADMSNGATCDTAPLVDLYESIGSNTPVISFILSGATVGITENPFQMAYVDAGTAYVKRDLRVKYKAVDFNQLFDDAGIQCVKRSSRTGNVLGIPQCLITNSPHHSEPGRRYRAVFGDDAFTRCYDENGKPCYASNGGVGAYPYDHEYGCFECSLGTFPYQCSKDEFALRPDRFDAEITHAHGPNLLRSGVDYNTTLTAIDADNAISSTYTVLNFHNIVTTAPPIKYFNTPTLPWEKDTVGLLQGTTTALPINPSHMINGLSRTPDTSAGPAQEIVGVTFDDVGRVSMYITDQNWSAVDNDDTPKDCNSTEHTFICGELNATFIPHHFSFAELNITNHAGPDSNFTYVADNRGMPTATPPTRSPMSARVHTRIEARNQQNEITQNFREDGAGIEFYYENNITVNQNVKIPTSRSLPTDPDAYIYGADANESEIDDKGIGFGRVGESEAKGTRNIKWDEDTYPLEFNFDRKINKSANPFDVNGSYYSISLSSIYTQPSVAGHDASADIQGSRIGDRNTSTCTPPPAGSCENNNSEGKATFYYGRTRSSEFFYEDITGLSIETPIAIDVYCDLNFSTCSNYGIDTVNGQINKLNWWLSWKHDTTRGDGNVSIKIGTLLEGTGAPKLKRSTSAEVNSIDINISTDGGKDNDISVIANATATQRPMTVPIELVEETDIPTPTVYTNHWLIYNPDDAILTPSPFYKVRFINESGWTGVGETGNILETDASADKTKRLNW